MNLRLLPPALLLSGACVLTQDGVIETTCDELGTCDSIEEGGVVYVESSPSSDSGIREWRVEVLNGFGEVIEEWKGQGEAGPVVYDKTTSTVYLSVNDSVRVLRNNIPPAVSGIAGVTDAIPLEGGVFFAYENFIGQILDDTLDARQELPNGTVFHVSPAVETEELATLLEFQGDDAFLLHIASTDGTSTPWTVRRERLVDVSINRLFDVFTDGNQYFSCADTGATFLIVPGVGINEKPDRYPNSANFTDLLSCDYRPETQEVVLFSASGGIALMNSINQLNFLVEGPTEGWQIVHGSVW